jgi:REP element-mobilizing transposase RayT
MKLDPAVRANAEIRDPGTAALPSCSASESAVGANTEIRDPGTAENAFLHFDGLRYRLLAWCVMPNHFHVLFQPLSDWSMAKIVASWKKFTATEIQKWPRANAEIRDPGTAALPSCSASESAVRANTEIRDPGTAALPSCSASESAVRANTEIRDPGTAALPSCSASESAVRANTEIRDPGTAALPSCSASESAVRANTEIRDPGTAALPSCSASESAVRANTEIRDPGTAAKSPLWHPEYWDRYIRNEKHFDDVVDYIHMNPVKAGFCRKPADWKWSSAYA